MAIVARASDVDIDLSNAQFVPQVPDLEAGEDIGAGKMVYIASADGKIYKCMADDGTGTPAADERGKVLGVTARDVKAGQPVTVFQEGTRIRLAPSGTLTAGQTLFVGDDGDFDDAATINDPDGVARALNDQEVLFEHTKLSTG